MGYIQGQWTPTKRRGPIAAEFTGPGPACISLPPLIGASTKDASKSNSPSFTLHGRPKEPANFITPSPAEYTPQKGDESVHEAAPKFSFGCKAKDAKPEDIPAPNKYSIPGLLGSSVREGTKRQSPSFTISGRNKMPDTVKTPGPGSYNTVEADVMKKKSPRYTLSQRYDVPSDKTKVPGPGAFSPEKVRQDANYSVSFGIRHSPYVGCLPEKQAKNV